MNAKKKVKLVLFSLLLCLLLATSIPVVFAAGESSVLVNGDDWRERYLGAVFAGASDHDILAISDLSDAEIKTATVKDDVSVVVLENIDDPIVTNYPSYLQVNGVNNARVITYSNYADLQEALIAELNPQGYIILDPRFGIEAVAAAPVLKAKNYAALFLSEDTYDYVVSKTREVGPENVILAGRFPVRLLQGIEANTIYNSPENEINAYALTQEAENERLSKGWGIITSIDLIDLSTLYQEKPIFVYA